MTFKRGDVVVLGPWELQGVVIDGAVNGESYEIRYLLNGDLRRDIFMAEELKPYEELNAVNWPAAQYTELSPSTLACLPSRPRPGWWRFW